MQFHFNLLNKNDKYILFSILIKNICDFSKINIENLLVKEKDNKR
jgi:hypothetical protein